MTNGLAWNSVSIWDTFKLEFGSFKVYKQSDLLGLVCLVRNFTNNFIWVHDSFAQTTIQMSQKLIF
jgi:hypothetical protein